VENEKQADYRRIPRLKWIHKTFGVAADAIQPSEFLPTQECRTLDINRQRRRGEVAMTNFIGEVRSGKGEHSALTIPGATDWHDSPCGWPARFHPGSLNVRILKNGYPYGFTDPDEGGRGVSRLDDGVIEPTVVLPWGMIENNRLRPKTGKPRRGTGQFWPAIITVEATRDSAACWVFRRIHSSIKHQLELVSSLYLREHLALADGTVVFVDVYERDELD
jgi:hypothetical protein